MSRKSEQEFFTALFEEEHILNVFTNVDLLHLQGTPHKLLKFQHCLYPGKSLRLHCGEPGCCLVFCTYSGYKRHLSRAHGDSNDSHPL